MEKLSRMQCDRERIGKQNTKKRWLRMFKWLARWILRYDYDRYLDGWKAGVNQMHYEPKSAWHGIKSYAEYWGEEE
jgi:hypothetical protein